MFIVHVPTDDVLNPGDVGRGAGEHGGFLVLNAADGAKTSDAVHLPGATHSILTHQRATGVSLFHKMAEVTMFFI